ncbi:hypothetical protein [Kitasatospora sp. NPDC059673]|uniref:hypothetical protein n=1 Tax=Kitasatospora sp. NPDC059673 TaxID=3346901 RepID=UPI0036BEA945
MAERVRVREIDNDEGSGCCGSPVGAPGLFTTWISPIRSRGHRFRWSQWRRRHQARARNSHYRRRRAAVQP